MNRASERAQRVGVRNAFLLWALLLSVGCSSARESTVTHLDASREEDASEPFVDAGARDASADSDATAPEADGEVALCPPAERPPSDPGTIACGASVCTGGDVCFIHPPPDERDECAPSSEMPAGTIARECDEGADCGAGQVCCLLFHYVGSSTIVEATCDSACSYGPPTQLCKTDAECASGACAGYVVAGGRTTVSTCEPPIGCE